MAPLSAAIDVKLTLDKEDGTKIYSGQADGDWTVSAVPNGGYILALMVEACIKYQSMTNHRDPIHVTAHFLQSSSVGPYEVYVRTMKVGRGYSNLVANFVQKDRTRVVSHIVFGTTTLSHPNLGPSLTLAPPSTYARRLPLYVHPATTTENPIRSTWNFRQHVKWSEDQVILAKNKPGSSSRTSSTTVGGGGVEWGAWFQFVDEGETVTPASLAYLVDVFQNMPALLPRSERAAIGLSWFPTMTLALEFKSPIPTTSSDYSRRTVGLYSSGRFMNDPQGRHDAYVEVWTSPSNIGEGEVTEGWRDKQVCLAVATQMALTVPIEVNQSRGKKESAKL